MITLLKPLLDTIIGMLRSSLLLHLEILALRQQLAMIGDQDCKRIRFHQREHLFWVLLYRCWPGCLQTLLVFQPETLVRWHRKGFQFYWRWKSCRGQDGRPAIDQEVRELIRTMSRDNVGWGAPRRMAWSECEHEGSVVKQIWADTNVILLCPCPHLVHHDPNIYNDPHVFDAGRFLGKKYKQSEFFPFGTANRVCLGINIAQMMMQRILKELLFRRRFLAFTTREFNPIRRNVSI